MMEMTEHKEASVGIISRHQDKLNTTMLACGGSGKWHKHALIAHW